MQSCVSESTFDLTELKTDPGGVSLYLTVPSKNKEEDFRWLRLMVSLVMTAMESTERRPASGHDVLLLLDEFADLKKMERVYAGMATHAKYGMKMCVVLQNLIQLRDIYGDGWENFLSNCGTKIWFGLEDQFTLEYLSKQLGQYELLRTELSSAVDVGGSRSQSLSRSTETNWSAGATTGQDFTFQRLPLGVNGLAAFVRSVTGDAQSSRSLQSTSTSGGSEGSSASHSSENRWGHSVSESHRIHLRDLATPDELRRYLRRIDGADTSTDAPYPGLAVVQMAQSPHPALVRRCNYFDDRFFAGLMTHASVTAKVNTFVEFNVGFDSLGAVKLLSGVVDRVRGPVAPKARWLVEVGGHVARGAPLLELFELVSPGADHKDLSGSIVLRSPVQGEVLQVSKLAQNAQQERWLAILVDGPQTPDESIIRSNQEQIDGYLRALQAVSGQIVQAIKGRQSRLLGGSVVALVVSPFFGWPGALLGIVLCVALAFRFVMTQRSDHADLVYMTAVRDFSDRPGGARFGCDGPFKHNPL